MTKSLCDTCRAPGSCCRGMAFNLPFKTDDWERLATEKLREKGLTNFVPVRLPVVSVIDKVPYSQVYFDCKLLGDDGRCSDYENRPDLCRAYQAGQDPLCAEYVQNIKGIPIIVQTVQPRSQPV